MAFLAADPNQTDPNAPGNQQVAGGAGGNSVVIGGATPTAGGAPTLGGSSAPIQGASTSGGAGAAGAAPTTSGSFTNLNNYVTANQGNDAQMGGAVQNTVKSAADSATAQGTSWQGATNTAIDNSTVKEDPNVIATLNAAGAGSGDVSGIDGKSFNNQFNAKYTGPEKAVGTDGYAGTQAAYDNVQTLGQQAAGDTGDRKNLLTQTYGGNGQQYTGGQKDLDSFILGNGAGGQQALQNINQQYGHYNDNFNGLSGLVDTRAAAGKATTEQTAKDVQAAAGGAYTGVEGRIGDAAGSAKTKNDAVDTQMQNYGNRDPAALKAAGFSPDAIAQMAKGGKLAVGNFATGPGADARYTAGDLASKPDLGNYQGLYNLIHGAGGTAVQKYGADQLAVNTPGSIALNQDMIAKANMQARPVTFDTAKIALPPQPIQQKYAVGPPPVIQPAQAGTVAIDTSGTPINVGNPNYDPMNPTPPQYTVDPQTSGFGGGNASDFGTGLIINPGDSYSGGPLTGGPVNNGRNAAPMLTKLIGGLVAAS